MVANALDAGLARVLAATSRLRVVAIPDGRAVVTTDEVRESPQSPLSESGLAVGERALEAVVRLVSAGPERVHVDVELGGWSARVSRSPLELPRSEQPEDVANDEELLEVLGLALDLVGAACFGDVRVHQVRRGRRLVEARVELAVAGGWSSIGEVRRFVWPFGRRVHTLLRNHEPRPSDCAVIEGPPLPWAPWAGRAGFVGRAAPSAQVVDLGRGGVLDLHGMEPRRVDTVVTEFLVTSQREGVLALRIIHGKGKGVFRDIVHRRLRTHPAVRGFRIAGHGAGGWGATLVDLHPLEGATAETPSDPSSV